MIFLTAGIVMKKNLFLITILLFVTGTFAQAQGYRYHLTSSDKNPAQATTLIGQKRAHIISPKETLLDVARNYTLGFNEMQILYPEVDPWIPKPGLRLTIPSQWILPTTKYKDIVINLPELRLYRFFPDISMVKTYPVGIGEHGSETPEGIYVVKALDDDPIWKIPSVTSQKYGRQYFLPGPDNPLGKFWIGLSNKKYGIHGTNMPWSVGRLISNGCIRLYPEHIIQLFQEVSVGTVVEITYEPVKFGFKDGQIFIEVHPDVYGRTQNMEEYAQTRIRKMNLGKYISREKMMHAIQKKNGIPVLIGSVDYGE